ncbi:MAG: proline dehydrogenase family protein [Armatimonadetes bacterium]|nr:proline dehydrogenase family protein [Armatimonadota bacterium]
MLRRLLLALAASLWLKKFVTSFPLARKVARRFVAGETLEDAIEAVRSLHGAGLDVTLDFLGENVENPAGATRAVKQYHEILGAIQHSGLEAHVSLKLTHLGMDLGTDLCLENLLAILTRAREVPTFVRIDMEGSEYTQRTLDVFEKARAEFDNIGIVIQAYLRRSKDDIAHINRMGGRVRLCKGAYHEPQELAYQERSEVTANCIDLMKDLLRDGTYPAIASHDEEILQATLDYVEQQKILRNEFEFQMLYGIRRERQLELLSEGYNVRIYVPFGTEWYPYFMRRLAERPANLVFFLTALFRG